MSQSLDVQLARTKTDRDICYQLRHQVFVVEQGVPIELENDDRDESDAIHFLGTENGRPVSTGRLCINGSVAKLQRIVVLNDCRGKGFGRDIVVAMMTHATKLENVSTAALDAQTYATKFYENLGFRCVGDEFLDADIPHIHMVRVV